MPRIVNFSWGAYAPHTEPTLNDDILISRAEAAVFLGISAPRLTQLTTAGEIAFEEIKKEGKNYIHYYKLTEVAALKAKREKQPERRGRPKKGR